MNQEQHLSSEESLQIISKMIQTAQGNVRASTFYFLLWGWICVIASVAHFYLDVYTTFEHPYAVWLIGIPGWIITFIKSMKDSSKSRVKTYSDDLIMWTWIGFGISILIIIFAGQYINFQITPLIMLLAGLCTFVTGIVIRFKPLIIGGSSFWIFTPLAFYLPTAYSPLIMAFGIICGYLIPAYWLRKDKNQ